MNSNTKYSITEIVTQFIKTYSLDNTESSQNTLRKKIERTCRKIPSLGNDSSYKNLWEETSTGKNAKHYFTLQQKAYLTSAMNEDLLTYCSDTPEKKKLIEAINKAEEANQVYRDYQMMRSFEEQPFPRVDIDAKIHAIMTKAIFEYFYEPIDEQKIIADIILASEGGGDNNTAETIMAMERLKNSTAEYCKRKKLK